MVSPPPPAKNNKTTVILIQLNSTLLPKSAPLPKSRLTVAGRRGGRADPGKGDPGKGDPAPLHARRCHPLADSAAKFAVCGLHAPSDPRALRSPRPRPVPAASRGRSGPGRVIGFVFVSALALQAAAQETAGRAAPRAPTRRSRGPAVRPCESAPDPAGRARPGRTRGQRCPPGRRAPAWPRPPPLPLGPPAPSPPPSPWRCPFPRVSDSPLLPTSSRVGIWAQNETRLPCTREAGCAGRVRFLRRKLWGAGGGGGAGRSRLGARPACWGRGRARLESHLPFRPATKHQTPDGNAVLAQSRL